LSNHRGHQGCQLVLRFQRDNAHRRFVGCIECEVARVCNREHAPVIGVQCQVVNRGGGISWAARHGHALLVLVKLHRDDVGHLVNCTPGSVFKSEDAADKRGGGQAIQFVVDRAVGLDCPPAGICGAIIVIQFLYPRGKHWHGDAAHLKGVCIHRAPRCRQCADN